MKKILYIIPILLLIIVLHNQASTTVVESNKYKTPANSAFDDDNFYKCITDKLGVSEDTNVTDEELASITGLYCTKMEITSTKGLEKLTGIISLNLKNNKLTNIDTTKNTTLKKIDLSSNNLTSLDASKNTILNELNLYNNKLTNIDVRKNIYLTDLNISDNQLTNIDVSKNTALTSLYLYSNQLTNIDVSKNTALTYLVLSDNNLTDVDLSYNLALVYLNISDNQLTNINVSKNTALTSLYLYNNQLASVDISKNTDLKYVYLPENELTNIDVSKNIQLKQLNLEQNQLKSIDVSKNTALEKLNLADNLLSNLDISNNSNLVELEIDEDVNIKGLRDEVSVYYSPILNLFPNSDMRINYEKIDDGKKHEYTIKISNNINKLVTRFTHDNKPNGSISYYNLEGELSASLDLLNLFSYANRYKGTVTLNDKELSGYSYSYINKISPLINTQCNENYPCKVYDDGKLVAEIDESEKGIIYKDDKIVCKIDDNSGYIFLTNLENGNNVLKIELNDTKYIINIIRSDKELNNNPNEELNNVLDEIVNNKENDVLEEGPNTGKLANILLIILCISMIGIMAYIVNKGKVKS